jgi:hypothetical protein
LLFEGVDEAEVCALFDMIQLIERIVVALIVGDEELTVAIASQAHWEAVPRGEDFDVE